jgi:predicted FMN-binding regulatory protein PaiB
MRYITYSLYESKQKRLYLETHLGPRNLDWRLEDLILFCLVRFHCNENVQVPTWMSLKNHRRIQDHTCNVKFNSYQATSILLRNIHILSVTTNKGVLNTDSEWWLPSRGPGPTI